MAPAWLNTDGTTHRFATAVLPDKRRRGPAGTAQCHLSIPAYRFLTENGFGAAFKG